MPQKYDEIYILYACDRWASRDSMRMVGATTDRDTLHAMTAHQIFESRMDFDGETGTAGVKKFREAYRKGFIPSGALRYGHVSESYNLDCRSAGVSPQYRRFHGLLNMDDEEFRQAFPAPAETGDTKRKTKKQTMAAERNRMGMVFNHDLYCGENGIDTLVDPWFNPAGKLPFPMPRDPDSSNISFYARYLPGSDTVSYICETGEGTGWHEYELALSEQESILLKDGMEQLCEGDHSCALKTLWNREQGRGREPDYETEEGMEP